MLRSSTVEVAVERIAVFAPADAAMRWIVEELAGEPYVLAPLPDIDDLKALVGNAEPDRPALVIADFDSLSRDEMQDLRSIGRQQHAPAMIALGAVPPDVFWALDIEHEIPRPLGSESLRQAVSDALRNRGGVEPF